MTVCTAPKNSSVEVSYESTQQGSAAADAASGVQAAIDAVHHQIAQALANVREQQRSQAVMLDNRIISCQTS